MCDCHTQWTVSNAVQFVTCLFSVRVRGWRRRSRGSLSSKEVAHTSPCASLHREHTGAKIQSSKANMPWPWSSSSRSCESQELRLWRAYMAVSDEAGTGTCGLLMFMPAPDRRRYIFHSRCCRYTSLARSSKLRRSSLTSEPRLNIGIGGVEWFKKGGERARRRNTETGNGGETS